MARTHVVMSEDVLEAIDRLVGERGRSRFIEQAAREKLDRFALEDALKATAGVLPDEGYAQWRDRAAASRWVRGTRRTERKR